MKGMPASNSRSAISRGVGFSGIANAEDGVALAAVLDGGDLELAELYRGGHRAPPMSESHPGFAPALPCDRALSSESP
jgi:hypothetical protein